MPDSYRLNSSSIACAKVFPTGQMRYRKLRIAWSVVWGIACLLLIVLWVRSYWQVEMFAVPLTNKYYFGAAYSPGCIGFAFHPMGQLSRSQIKRFQSFPTESWLETVRQ